MDVCDACYIYRNYYKCLKKESYEKSDDSIDNDDDDYYDDDDNDDDIKSKALDVCDACYIFRNYYKSLKKESYEKSDDFIDDDDDDDDDDVVDGDVKGPGVITDVELEVQNTQYTKKSWHVLSSHLQIIKADDLKERCKNKIIHTKAQCYSDHAHMP